MYSEDYRPAMRLEPVRPKHLQTKPVRCIDTGEVFESVTAAAERYGTSSSHVTSVCRGRRPRAGGVRWEYAGGGMQD